MLRFIHLLGVGKFCISLFILRNMFYIKDKLSQKSLKVIITSKRLILA